MTPLQIDTVQSRLCEPFAVHYFPEVTSTNDLAIQMARDGASECTVVCTDFQTAGRGRRGAVWTAPAGTGVLFSLILRPETPCPPQHLAILTGVGSAMALESLDVPVQIKWPNDLWLEGRKVGGILVETIPGAVIIGVGVNYRVPTEALPEEIRERAASIVLDPEPAFSREDVLVALVDRISTIMLLYQRHGISEYVMEWNIRNCFMTSPVRVTGPMGSVEGRLCYLDEKSMQFAVYTGERIQQMPLSSTMEAL